jgi:aryl-alcohol dehydrogenase-like predicted oxidoreductase
MSTTMQYAQLGRSGLKVSRLCLGTMNFGPETSEADAFKIMDRALELGLNFFDTANVYGWKKGEGWTEQIVGRWLAQGGGRRDKIVLATKVYGEMGTLPNQGRLSAYHVRRACEESLKRLRTDVIDLYQMHHVDRATPWEELWQAMEVLIQQGKVTYVGSSNFAGWHIAQASEIARSRGTFGLVSEQCKYNLLTRLVETEIQPACERYGIGLVPYSPVGGGLLAGSGRRGTPSKTRRESDWATRDREKHGPALEQDFALCRELGQEPADVALAWVLSRPAVVAPIVGPRTMEHLESCVAALSIRLDNDTLEKLDAIFPGYRPSPEAFAW